MTKGCAEVGQTPAAAPSRNDPVTFTVNVPNGKRPILPAQRSVSHRRQTAPRAPPPATQSHSSMPMTHLPDDTARIFEADVVYSLIFHPDTLPFPKRMTASAAWPQLTQSQLPKELWPRHTLKDKSRERTGKPCPHPGAQPMQQALAGLPPGDGLAAAAPSSRQKTRDPAVTSSLRPCARNAARTAPIAAIPV